MHEAGGEAALGVGLGGDRAREAYDQEEHEGGPKERSLGEWIHA
jgi:hypothetical protein